MFPHIAVEVGMNNLTGVKILEHRIALGCRAMESLDSYPDDSRLSHSQLGPGSRHSE